MPLAGNLRQFALPDVLRVIESGQRTGRLFLERGPRQAAIYFSGGQWLLAERIGVTLTLAQQFARAGLIAPDQFEMATGASLASADVVPDVQAVRALINARVLTQEQLRAWLVDDAVTLLVVLLTWPDGDFLFEDGVMIPQDRVALPLPIGPLVTQAQRQARNESHPHQVAPLAPEAVVDFAEVDLAGPGIQITRDQWKVLTAVDGHASLWDISQRVGERELMVLRIAGELASNGIITVVGRAR
ncbi:MAG: DUF4388 domain-containing protein [Ktedonobacterales bacterium]